MKRKMFHGTTTERAFQLIEDGKFEGGHNNNPWSAECDLGGLFVTNNYKYAQQFGEAIIIIEVDENELELELEYEEAYRPGDEDYDPDLAGACEYMIEDPEAEFTARWTRPHEREV